MAGVVAAIKNLTLSGNFISPTPANTANVDNVSKLFTFSNITILSAWQGSFVIANQLVSIASNAASPTSVPNFLLVLVDNPIRFIFNTTAGDISIATPITNALLISIPPTTSPVGWIAEFDGTIAANTNCPLVAQGNPVNYQIFACQGAVS